MSIIIPTADLPHVQIVGTKKDGLHIYEAECINPKCDHVNRHEYALDAISFRNECVCGSNTKRVVVDKLSDFAGAPFDNKKVKVVCTDDVCLTCD
jgi:hypothetical protein